MQSENCFNTVSEKILYSKKLDSLGPETFNLSGLEQLMSSSRFITVVVSTLFSLSSLTFSRYALMVEMLFDASWPRVKHGSCNDLSSNNAPSFLLCRKRRFELL